MPLKRTILAVSLHDEKEHPLFGDVTRITIEDEDGGGYIKLVQPAYNNEPGCRLNIDELEEVLVIAREMISAYDNNVQSGGEG